MTKARIHLWLVLFALIDYGAYAIVVGLRGSTPYYVIGGVYSWLAAIAAAIGKWWSKPLVWSLGSLLVIEWLAYTLGAYRAGKFHPGSAAEFALAAFPGLLLASVIGYCCHVVHVYVAPRSPQR